MTGALRTDGGSELRLAVLTLLLPLYCSVVFATCYIGALDAPKPDHVKVAIVGAPSLTAPLARALTGTPGGGFAVSQLSSLSQARRLVARRTLDGAYVASSDTTAAGIVAGAASSSLANYLAGVFRQIAAGHGQPIVIDDVRPLPRGNPSGNATFFFLVICTLAGLLTVIALGVVAPSLRERHRLAIAGAAALLAPLIAYLIGGVGYHAFGGSPQAMIAMIAAGALYAFAVAITTRMMQVGLGRIGSLLASLVFIFMNFPSSGGIVATQLMPGFWNFLSRFWLGATGLDAVRSTLYFGGAGVGHDLLKLIGWIAVWAVALTAIARLHRARLVTA